MVYLFDRRAALGALGVGVTLSQRAWAAPPAACGAPPCAFGPTTSLAQARRALTDILEVALLPFWRRLADTSTAEGYDLNHDARGDWLGPANPTLVGPGARALVLRPPAPTRARGAGRRCPCRARLRDAGLDACWTGLNGGFFWEVAARSYAPTLPDKQLYGQTFALYALSEHALATRSPAAIGGGLGRVSA